MGLKQVIKEFCPNEVLSVYGSLVCGLRQTPKLARDVYSFTKGLGPRFEEIKLKRKLFGSNAPMVPPKRLIVDGSWSLVDYKNVGDESKRLFVECGQLHPDSNLLDLGCGIGRCAIPLTQYLSKSGKYLGLDVDAKAIAWCERRIATRYQNFTFRFLDVYSDNYNPHGKLKASSLRLPIDDKQVDFVAAMSLFSHMFFNDATHYFSEIYRILKPGGCLLMTGFLLNDESRSLVQAGHGLQLVHHYGDALILDPKAPETAVGHSQEKLLNTLDAIGFKSVRIHHGSWCGRSQFLSYQDVLVCRT